MNCLPQFKPPSPKYHCEHLFLNQRVPGSSSVLPPSKINRLYYKHCASERTFQKTGLIASGHAGRGAS